MHQAAQRAPVTQLLNNPRLQGHVVAVAVGLMRGGQGRGGGAEGGEHVGQPGGGTTAGLGCLQRLEGMAPGDRTAGQAVRGAYLAWGAVGKGTGDKHLRRLVWGTAT